MIDTKKLKEKSGIYLIINQINGHKYVGQSINIKIRFQRHHLCDYKNKNSSVYKIKLYQAFRKYGIENFEVRILEYCETELLDEREKYWIKYFDTFKNGYNSTEGGQNWSENIFSEETKNRRRKTLEKNKSLSCEKHPRSKLTNEEVIKIRQRYIDGESVEQIYSDYKNLYSKDTFKNIIFGRSYKKIGNVPQKEQIRYTNKNRKLGKLKDEIVREIRYKYSLGNTSYPKLAKEYNVSIPTIASIIKYQLYKTVK